MEPLSDQLNEDQLIRDFKSVVADVEALLKATANTGGDKLAEVRAKAETSLGVVNATFFSNEKSASFALFFMDSCGLQPLMLHFDI